MTAISKLQYIAICVMQLLNIFEKWLEISIIIDYVIKGVGIGNAHSIINLIRVAQYRITIP